MLTLALGSVPRGGALSSAAVSLPWVASSQHPEHQPRVCRPHPAPRSRTTLSCSLRAAVALPPGPRDLRHGQLPAPDEGAWGLGRTRGSTQQGHTPRVP